MSGTMPAPPANGSVVEAAGIGRVFPMAAGEVAAVRDVSLTIGHGDHVAIRGPSGCG